jgi:carbamoyl-phosphate synthase large subunit
MLQSLPPLNQSFTPFAVLITSAAKKVPLIRAVLDAACKIHPQIKVIAGDSDENALTRYVADGFWHMPKTIDKEVESLLEGCKAYNIRVIVPTRDGELLFWARHRTKFLEAGINIVVSSASSVEVCVDKLAFAQFGIANALSVIPSGLHPKDVGLGPYVIKERYGAGALKIKLNLDCKKVKQFSHSMEAPIYQPYIRGKEISIDAWLDQKCQVKGLVLRTRDRVINGESQITTTFRDPEIEREATKALNTLKLCGPVVMQAFIDKEKCFHIIECNSRIGGASTASIAVGLDIFCWILLETYGLNLDNYEFVRSPTEVRQIRVPYDIHEFFSAS